MRIKETHDIPASSATNPEYQNNNRFRATEYFFDFDDTLFDTTGYYNAIWEHLETLGLTRDQIVELYESCKIPDERTGEKMYRQDVFIDKLRDRFPEQVEAIEIAFRDVSYGDFIHEDMAHLLRLLTSSPVSRVHILTYGDVDTQRRKVEAVLERYGIPMDILYAQIPKADFLSRYLPEQYPYLLEDGSMNVQSFVVIDDSTDELEKLMTASKDIPFFAPLRLRKPEAKKSAREQKGEPAYEVAERYELILYEVMKSLQELRRSGRATTQEWFNQNMVELIRKHVEQEVSPRDQLEVRDGENGTLIVSRKIRAFPGNKSVLAFEREIAFDEIEGKMYEVVRDTNGQITKKKEWSPFYSDVIDRGLQAA